MSFQSNLGGIRAWGRKWVLPVDLIKMIIKEEVFDKYYIDKIINFGAGTLYWSKWFQTLVGTENIYPVDIIFKEKTDPIFCCFSEIQNVPYKEEGKGPIMFFACDVLHHLSDQKWKEIEQTICQDCDFIVIKDINCRFKFKNWMNRMHDRIINGERIRDIDPETLIMNLHTAGYQCMYRDIHKLWYPHFILIAVRENRL